jgi:23S rRNA pseudouridine1911/1915/1917 synthase
VRTFCDVCDFSVVAETEDWIVVNKPAPLQVHPSKPDGGPTLWHGLRELLRYELENGAALSLINRLDRDTSGLVLVAKHKSAARTLHKAMMRREVEKEYRAIVWGWPEHDTFDVREPILRRGDVEPSPIYAMQKIHADGAASHTTFRVLQRFGRQTENGTRFSLLAAVPHTGRMHQIRIHAAYAGHQVIGDKLYGPDCEWYLRQISDGWTPAAAAALLLPRHALHSCLLGITTEAGAHHTWHAPLPQDMAAFIPGGTAV